jgi:hypothetical protein
LNYWPFWISGLALAGVMLVHWLTTGRMMAVSGRFSALVNRLRYGDEGEPLEVPLDQAELIRAIQAMTTDAFGAEAAAAADPDAETPGSSGERMKPEPSGARATPAPQTSWMHVVFFSSLALGGLASALLWGTFQPTFSLRSPGFANIFGEGLGSSAALLLGGTLTGFGTRMAGGCTSGHGLIGVSRLQPGSLLATAGFFGAGILVSLLLEAL